MSMTKEEAIKWLEEIVQDTDTYWGSCSKALQKELDEQKQVFLLALSALRPITREQVEKMRGKFFQAGIDDVAQDTWRCSRCLVQEFGNIQGINFCPSCGAPMTDEAVETIMKRMEEMRND